METEDRLLLKLGRTSEISGTNEKWERLKGKIEALESDGVIDEAKFETHWKRRELERKRDSHAWIGKLERWESNSSFELPIKEDVHPNGDRHLILPQIFLRVNEGVNLKGFFPCSDGETEYSIDWFLDCLEEGRDWEKWEDNPSTLSTKDPSRVHGAIKSHIKNNPEELLGKGWRYSEDEYVVGGFGGGGQIDLIFKHESETRYNLVEVKPSKETEKVDRAFGQLFRYRHSFVNDKISVGIGDVELTVAAPDFHDSHREAAEELGISLVHTPYAEPV